MLGSMFLLRKIDQEEPIVLFYARLAFVAYMLGITSLYAVLHWRITARRDLTPVIVPLKSKSPSFSDALEQAKKAASDTQAPAVANKEDESTTENSENKQEEQPETETITTMEYDLRTMDSARKSWVFNCLVVAAINYKTESVSAIAMSLVMTIVRVVTEDPLFLIHVCGTPADGKLKRPFTVPESPFASLLKEMAPKPQSEQPKEETPGEDLHDEGDSEEEDSVPATLTDMADDHIKGDFDEEENVDDKESKKNN